jgi:hypothetical protein
VARNTISAKAASLDVVLEEGAGLTVVMTKFDENNVPLNLAGYTGRLTVKAATNSVSNLLELTTENSGISLGTTTDNITWVFTEAAVTSASWTNGIYNFYLTNGGGEPEREITGTIRIAQGT